MQRIQEGKIIMKKAISVLNDSSMYVCKNISVLIYMDVW